MKVTVSEYAVELKFKTNNSCLYYDKRDDIPYFVLLRCRPLQDNSSGAAGVRTLVQTRNQFAFYMFIF